MKLTYLEAKELAGNMTQKGFDRFVDGTGQRNVVEYITLFRGLGIDQKTVWDLYENWQNNETQNQGR